MSTHDDNDLAAIEAELRALGEPLDEDLGEELREARLVSDVLAAAGGGADAVSRLEGDAPEALDTLHMLRGAAGADELGEFAMRRGLQRVREQVQPKVETQEQPDNVVPLWRRGPVRVLLAAAAVLLVAAATLFLLPVTPQGPSPNVVQAQQRVTQVEAQALKKLMAGAATAEPGDHGLRELRQARYDVIAARAKARARRL